MVLFELLKRGDNTAFFVPTQLLTALTGVGLYLKMASLGSSTSCAEEGPAWRPEYTVRVLVCWAEKKWLVPSECQRHSWPRAGWPCRGAGCPQWPLAGRACCHWRRRRRPPVLALGVLGARALHRGLCPAMRLSRHSGGWSLVRWGHRKLTVGSSSDNSLSRRQRPWVKPTTRPCGCSSGSLQSDWEDLWLCARKREASDVAVPPPRSPHGRMALETSLLRAIWAEPGAWLLPPEPGPAGGPSP